MHDEPLTSVLVVLARLCVRVADLCPMLLDLLRFLPVLLVQGARPRCLAGSFATFKEGFAILPSLLSSSSSGSGLLFLIRR